MGSRFIQQNSQVPEWLRDGTLVRTLPDNTLRAASILVNPGYFTAARVAEVLEASGATPEEAREAVRAARAAYRAHLDRSDGEGDWARFDAACDAIAARGILVRHNFTCCRTCADAEIGDDRADEWGYVYFTQQDAEALAYAEPSVYLGYGSFGPSPSIDPAELASAQGDDERMSALYERTFDDLAAAITSALDAQGLRYEWDGDTGTRIRVVGMDWRRPLPEDDVAPPAAPAPESRKRNFGFRF
ncbi:DUF6891 domain-containing protein [Tsukamurella paurometabola]|uniref:DUF6891 domain-containing protein n=1 Tax=Tsukamurella paurometabola TaxID=2061 RepID=A0A3P8MDC2_TSUPA|nr:hypothetical protein [Tsukamurella paurometabola]MBS4100081.1 hypothetical protein [Tsukamurella paurometabola]UEA83136.1 hypothetical protein LK411_22750 [Tsukamurella paurometabola]VDR40226.1 Uncharacterised protein [Tsukamurella paurometabola]